MFTELVRRAGREAEFVIDSAAPQLRRLATRRTTVPLPSYARPEFPSSHIAHVRCVARSMATGIALSIWMPRTRAACVAHLGDDPDGKITRLLDWTERPGDVADSWYTGNFDATYRDVLGCTAMLEQM